MKKIIKGFVCFGLIFLVSILPVKAQEENKILGGVFAEEMSLEGKTAVEAQKMIEDYVDSLSDKVITLVAVDGNEIQITPADIGLNWSNPEIIEEAVRIGQTGNVVQRYKAAKDLEHENKVYQLEFDVDMELVKTILSEQCSACKG